MRILLANLRVLASARGWHTPFARPSRPFSQPPRVHLRHQQVGLGNDGGKGVLGYVAALISQYQTTWRLPNHKSNLRGVRKFEDLRVKGLVEPSRKFELRLSTINKGNLSAENCYTSHHLK